MKKRKSQAIVPVARTKALVPDSDDQEPVETPLPPELQRLVSVVAMQVRHQTTHYSGPLPPPAMLKEYNDAVPNMGERLLASFEAEGPHRRELENREMRVVEQDAEARRAAFKRGQVLSFVIQFSALLLALAFIISNQFIVGGLSLGGVVIFQVVSAVMRARQPKPLPPKTQP